MLAGWTKIGIAKLVIGLAFVAFAIARAQPLRAVPRWNGNPAKALTDSLPSANPWPEYTQWDKCPLGPPCQGQSVGVVGALHLNGCNFYQITLCGNGGTLSGGGTVQVGYCPETPSMDAGNCWAIADGLKEAVTVAAGTQCQSFFGHQATGLGWIYPVNTGITTSAGATANIKVEASCSN